MVLTAVASQGIQNSYPLSPMQLGMLFHAVQAQQPGVDVEQIVADLHEAVDALALARAWQRVVARHAILRTSFRWQGLDEPQQVVHPEIAVPFVEEDWRSFPAAERHQRLAAFLRADRRRGFDLAEPPLLRLALFRFADDAYTLVWTLHHILLDGRAFPLVLREVFALYEAGRAGGDLPLPSPRPYRDHIAWLAGQDLAGAETFWRESLRGFTTPTPLVVERQRRAEIAPGTGHRTAALRLAEPMTARLRAFAEHHAVTLNTLVQGAWAVLLSRYSGEEEIVFGATRACRRSSVAGAEAMVGIFINTLPVRARVTSDRPLIAWLQELRASQVAVRPYEHTPLTKVQEWSDVPHGTPLFESLLMFDNSSLDTTLRAAGGAWQRRDFRLLEETNYPLTLRAYGESALLLDLEYAQGRFDDAAIERMLGHLRTLLEGLLDHAAGVVGDLPLLAADERHRLLVERNAAPATFPVRETLAELFAAQAARSPEAVAVTCDGAALTYEELNRRADRLAHRLRALGVGPEVLVGLCVERSLDLVVGIVGILKAGAAYLPLDPDFPAERLAFMLADAAVPVLVTQSAMLDVLPPSDARVVCLDTDWSAIAREEAGPLDGGAVADDLAYVIYTSGSTGRPKGVMVEHGALANFLAAMAHQPGLAADDVLLAVTTLSFDIAALELFLPLTVGARVVLADRATTTDGARLAARLAACGATALQATPATWRLLLAAGWAGAPGLLALCGGEALPRDLADALLPRVGALWNMYGPTETTIWSAVTRVVPGTGPVPVGLPIANTAFHLLDPHGQPVPVGIPGELHIGGAGLSRGYLNRPELTAERFIPDPFAADPGARLYKTGDLARRRPDGQLEFLGRLDHQVKVRGYRIELGEIEAALAAHPAVRQAVVAVREDAPGDQRLVAYVVAAGATPPAASELRPFLKAALPEYMVPAVFVALDTLPLTPNGKVDRKALPAPQVAPGDGASRAPVAPGDTLELQLVALWEGVLGVRPIGVDDNFFDLGGHSLLAVRLFGEIERVFGRTLPLATLFRAPTVAQFAAILRQPEHAPSWSPLVLLAGGGEQPPLFLAHAIGGNVLNYRDLARGLGGDRPVYGLQALGLDGQQAPLTRVEEMAARYLAEVRRVQPAGPYHLGGQCFGGMIALEMAQQLQAAGETVALLAMFDNEAPGYTKALPAGRRVRLTADWFARRARFHARQLTEQPAGTWLPYLGARGATVIRRGRSRIWGLAGRAYRHVGQPLPESLRNVREAALLAQRDYVPRPYHGRPVLFVVNDSEEPVTPGSQYGWEGLATGGVEIIEVPGDHKTMLSEPHVSTLATRLRDCLAWAERAA